MKKLVILDFVSRKVHTYNVESKLPYFETVQLIKKLGHEPESCDWLVVDSDNDIIVH